MIGGATVAQSPGWESVRGARAGTYREVWSAVYDLDPGRGVTAPELKMLRGSPDRASIHRAMAIAERVGVVTRLQNKRGGPRVWIRQPWPVLTITALQRKGLLPVQALNFLQALESAGYLECDKAGRYRPKE